MTTHDRAETLQTCREMVGLYDAESKHHKDSSVLRMKKNEDDVHKVIDIIVSWVEPSTLRDTSKPLINIASGMKAHDRITDDLLTAQQKGNEAFATFVDFFATLAKSNLQTFSNLVKLKRAKSAATDNH